MSAQQVNIDTISNNLANVNTTGFKKARAEFQDLLYTQLQSPVRQQAAGIAVGHGSRLSSVQRFFVGGSLQATGNDYDVAIQGSGFFRVQRADGTIAYTRDGAFRLDEQGQLVTSAGEVVLGATGPIKFGPGSDLVNIGPDGTVRQGDTVVGRISLALFANPAGLEAAGNNLWLETGASGNPRVANPGEPDAGGLVQFHLEASNVQTVEEMVNLIVAQRAYEINSKVVQSADEMMSLANNLRRG